MKLLHLAIAAFLSCTLAMANRQIDLVFIVDGSASIDADDWELQKEGISIAIKNPTLIPRNGSIALAVVQFSFPDTKTEVPYTIIENQADIDTVVGAVMAMVQISLDTNPGDGIAAATELLTPSFRTTANQTFCMSSDGLQNSGVLPTDAIDAAKTSAFGLDTFGMIAIEDGYGALKSDFQLEYGPLVFGGGSVVVVRSAAEFANIVGFVCFPSIDTELVGLEVVQVSQDLKNSVVLVQDKATLVRAYVQPLDPLTNGIVQVELHGYRDGVEFPDSPLMSSNSGGISVAANALDRRGILDESFNFRIPLAWTSGTVELEIKGVGTSLTCLEVAGPIPNDCKATVTFHEVPPLEVKFVEVQYHSISVTNGRSAFINTTKSNATDLSELENRLLAIYPVSSIDRTNGFLDMELGVPQAIDLNTKLFNLRKHDNCYSWLGCDRLYYGVVDQGGELKLWSDNIRGLASTWLGAVSCGIMEDGNAQGRNTHAHEIAHTMGVHHAVTGNINNRGEKVGVCNEVAIAIETPNFPFFESVDGVERPTIGPLSQGANDIIFGWDSYRNVVIDPKRSFELMSYCGEEATWISSYTYTQVFTFIESTYRRRKLNHRKLQTTRKLQTRYTVIRAIVDTDTANTTFLPAFQSEVPSAPPVNSTEYQIVGKNASGGEEFRVAVDPISYVPDVVSPGQSAVRVNAMYVEAFVQTPATGLIASVLVERGGSVIGAAQSVSANAPTVTVIYPNGGESLSGTSTTISWTSSDVDGDILSYNVLFSPDSGTTWNALTVDHMETSLEVPLYALGKSDFGLIRVEVSDGFNTGEDVSDGSFTTPNIPPEVQIWSPSNDDSFAGGQLVVFQASSFDVEDGKLADSDLIWTSDIDGILGNGKTLEILASSLSENNHTVELTGYDWDGAMSVATVRITIHRISPVLVTASSTATDSSSATPTISPLPLSFYLLLLLVTRVFFNWLISII